MTKEEARKLLSDTKVYVGEHRDKVIDKLKEIGLTEKKGDQNPEFLYLINNGSFVGRSQISGFFNSGYKQISMSEILDIQIDEEFKDGDILACSEGCVFIFNGKYFPDGDLHFHVGIGRDGKMVIGNCDKKHSKNNLHIATEEESARLFKALSDAGKKWNAENKCVEDLLVQFKPFDKVLCRDRYDKNWTCDLYSHKEDDLYMTIGCFYKQCIPYEGNESLLGTSLPY